MLEFSPKQKEFIRERPRKKAKWNFKVGAVRSGKSYEDVTYEVPNAAIEQRGLAGLSVIIGVSKSTIERNVLQPMREIYTEAIVGRINSQNIAMIAGEPFYCLGGEKISQVGKLQGASIKFCYGDEVAKWNPEVFEMLKSRLDKEYSYFVGACNPESERHWLKQFFDTPGLDIYIQHYTIFDNPFLPKKYVDELCLEYSGTVYYERYILGRWCFAESVIYKAFANKPQDYIISEIPRIRTIVLGVDFGGNGSAHTFVATGYTPGFKLAIHLESERIEATGLDPNDLNKAFVKFVEMVQSKYEVNQMVCYCDSAEQTLINGIRNTCNYNMLGVKVVNAKKKPIKDRINLQIRLLGLKRLLFNVTAKSCINAYQTAVYNEKPGHEDERLDDGTSDIDTMDASEYTLEPYMNDLLQTMEY